MLRNVYAVALIGITTPHHHILAQTTTENYAAVSEDNIINNDSKNQNASVYFNRGKALEDLQKAAELFEQEDKISESKRVKEVIDQIERDVQ
ncbi:hypothetical protein [Dapis sp. BLCC M172]|uniref:hypothetical protein n=1 Tax=Dapis sp. BLCC M172 TaxID=2975281 RepID=UPI003CF0CCDD